MLASTLQGARPDVTIIISDDQDEWFYEHNMPRFVGLLGRFGASHGGPKPRCRASNPQDLQSRRRR